MTCVLLLVLGLLAQAEPIEPIELLPLNVPPAAPPPASAPAFSPPPAGSETLLSQPITLPPGTEAFVKATSLALRSGPAQDATLIHYMPHDARVTVVKGDMDPVPATVGGMQGHWVYVQHATHYGWTFDQFLSAAPVALEENLDWVAVPGARVGPIKVDTTLEQLKAVFGQANVGEAKIPVSEGRFESGTVIFADSPERRLFVQWAYPNKRIHSVIVEGTRWRTPAGIGIGARLSDIVRANGTPVAFAGFEWQYSGYIMSWNGGLLERDHVLGEGIYLYLAAHPPYLPADYDALKGDKEFSSDMPEANKLNISVRAMTILMRN